MKNIIFCVMVLILCCADPLIAQEKLEQDTVKTSGGDLQIAFIGHGSLIFQYQNHHIYIDPFSQLADYAAFPKADIIFLTHHHRDHLDIAAINLVRTDKTEFILTPECARQLQTGMLF